MPRFDGTGPMGYGPMTGRGRGYCVGARRPMYRGRVSGRGRGYGMGYGRGYAYGPEYYEEPQYIQKPSKELLEDQQRYLEEELEAIKKQLSEME